VSKSSLVYLLVIKQLPIVGVRKACHTDVTKYAVTLLVFKQNKTQILKRNHSSSPLINLMQYYSSSRALNRRLQEDSARDVGEGPRVLMSFRVDFGFMS